MSKQKSLLDEATLNAAKELEQAATEVTEKYPEPTEINGGLEELLKKDVILKQEIQSVLTRDGGRCDNLDIDQQAEYKKWLCAKIGVSPTLQPIDLIPTKNGLRPYLNKGAAELIRDERKISITDIEVSEKNGMFVAICKVRAMNGRVDCDMGACQKGDEPENSLMKAVTKAKRRATLSMCGLGVIIEEAHPTEYNGEKPEETPSPNVTAILEDEAESKRNFQAVVLSKIDVDELPKEVWQKLMQQTMRLADTQSYEDAARWLQENDSIALKKDGNGNVVKATIKEAKNASTAKG